MTNTPINANAVMSTVVTTVGTVTTDVGKVAAAVVGADVSTPAKLDEAMVTALLQAVGFIPLTGNAAAAVRIADELQPVWNQLIELVEGPVGRTMAVNFIALLNAAHAGDGDVVATVVADVKKAERNVWNTVTGVFKRLPFIRK